jgi:hypothetical protein
MTTQTKLKDPIFVCGEGRSGTKLIRDTLARHSNINFFRCETYLFVESKIHKIKALDDATKSKDLEYLTKAVLTCLLSKNKNIANKVIKTKDFNPEIESLSKELLEKEGLKMDKLDIFDKAAKHLTLKADKLRWLEKTPFHVYYLKEILTKYPKAKIILTLRNPKAVYASWKKKDNNKSLIGVARSWNKVSKEITEAQKNFPENTFLLKFEDLLEEPEKKLTELCNFLEEDFETELLNAEVVNSKFIDNKKKGFDKEIINRWQEQLSQKEKLMIDELCQDNYADFAYKHEENNDNISINLFDYFLSYASYIIKKVKKLFSWLRI